MDNKALSAFVTLAEQLHFGRAAEHCHLSASALSRLVQRLEAEVGAVLFLRDNRRVTLTAEGERFLVYARDALQRWEACRQALGGAGRHLTGDVKLYCSVTASYHFLSQVLPRFRAQYPGVDIHLHTGDQAESLQRVISGSEDVAIAARIAPWPERLAFLPMSQTGLVFIQPAMSRPVRDEARDWSSVPLIVAEQGISRQRFDAWCLQSGVQPNLYAQVAGHEAIVGMVSLGYGVGVVPELVLESSPLRSQVEVCEDAPELEPVSIGLCCLRRHLADLRIAAFWRVAKEAFPSS